MEWNKDKYVCTGLHGSTTMKNHLTMNLSQVSWLSQSGNNDKTNKSS